MGTYKSTEGTKLIFEPSIFNSFHCKRDPTVVHFCQCLSCYKKLIIQLKSSRSGEFLVPVPNMANHYTGPYQIQLHLGMKALNTCHASQMWALVFSTYVKTNLIKQGFIYKLVKIQVHLHRNELSVSKHVLCAHTTTRTGKQLPDNKDTQTFILSFN